MSDLRKSDPAPADPTAGALSRIDPDPIVEQLGAILDELRHISAGLDRAETAGHHAVKVVTDTVAPFFRKLGENKNVRRFLQ